MDGLDLPILDNHLHLHPAGKGVDAAQEFARAGGTHLLVVNRPSWHIVETVEDIDAFRETFEVTVDLVDGSTHVLDGRAWAVLGVHPALLTQLLDAGRSIDAAVNTMKTGLELAQSYVSDGRAIALKSGRPHYPVDEPVWAAANEVLRHAIDLAAEADCALQLHTEASDDLGDIATWASDAGLDPTRVVKHYADGPVRGVIPSVIARRDPIDTIVAADVPFFLETDYLDDPDRPGAVLGPKTVPRRSSDLAEAGAFRALERAHIETPAAVYGIDTEATLDR